MEKARILIVEDEAIIAVELESQLQSLGYEVTSKVDTGEKAIKKAEEDKPDLILMDIRIKGEMDGIAAAEVIRNKFGIPVIFSTAYLDEERIERSKMAMPFGCLLKPIQERDLKVTLEMALYVSKVDAARKQMENELLGKKKKIEERVKELNCLYGISELIEKPGISLIEIFQGTVDLVRLAWQYPDITCVRLNMDDQEFCSKNFRETIWKQTAKITVHGQVNGSLDVFYLDEKAEEDEGPFIREERNLIDAVSKRLGRITERKQAAESTKLRERQLVQADKMISLGILVSGVAHEINNPNYVIASNIFPLKKIWEGITLILNEYHNKYGDFEIAGMEYSMVQEQISNIFTNISDGSGRIKNIVHELKQFARDQPDKYVEMIQLNNVVQSALTLLQSMIKKSTKHFSYDLHEDLPLLKGNYQQLEQVVINLLQNACQALTNVGESICVSTHCDHLQETLILEIVDEGSGIPKERLKRVTDPFFTTKREIGGVGLGLSISSKLVIEHGGSLRFTPGLERGTIVTVSLPLPPEKKTNF